MEGEANRALIRLLAATLDVAPSRVRVVTGTAARRKVVAVDGLTPPQLLERWPGLRVRAGPGV